MTTRASCFAALLCLAAMAAWAQQPGLTPEPRGPQPGPDPLGRSFFPPELVMQNQQAIALTAEQRTRLKTDIREAQLKFTELEWKLQDEGEKMMLLADPPRVDEQQVLAQLDKVLSAEREMKRAQIALLVRIKNALTPDQQAKLQELRGKPTR